MSKKAKRDSTPAEVASSSVGSDDQIHAEADPYLWDPDLTDPVMPNHVRRIFKIYYESLPRSLTRLHALLGETNDGTKVPSIRTLENWSSKYDWQEAIWRLETAQYNADMAAWKEERRLMNARHAEMALLGQQRATQRLASMDPDELTPPEARRLLSESVRLEQEARAVPPENPQVLDAIPQLQRAAWEAGLEEDEIIEEARRICAAERSKRRGYRPG